MGLINKKVISEMVILSFYVFLKIMMISYQNEKDGSEYHLYIGNPNPTSK